MTNPTLSTIATLAARRNLTEQHGRWVKMRRYNRSGYASMPAQAITRGEGIFWHQLDELPGAVRLFEPDTVLTALETAGKVAGQKVDAAG